MCVNTLTSLPDRPLHGIPPPLWHGPKSLSRPGTPQRSHYSFHLRGDNSSSTPRAVSRPGTPHGSHTPRSLLGSTSSHRPIASPRPKSPPRPVSARLSRVCASSSVGPGAGLLRPRRPDSAPSRLNLSQYALQCRHGRQSGTCAGAVLLAGRQRADAASPVVQSRGAWTSASSSEASVVGRHSHKHALDMSMHLPWLYPSAVAAL